MAFTLRQIEVFVEAAKDQNFRRTADRLNVSQPAISRHIRLLEQHAGGALFLRERGSRARLSPLGEQMLGEARAMLRSADKVSAGPGEHGVAETTVKIAAGTYLLDRWIRPNVARLFGAQEALNLEFVPAGNHEDLLRLVGTGEVDCAFYTGNSAALPGLNFHPLREASVGLYAAPALARTLVRVPQDFSNLPIVLSNKGTPPEAWQLETLRGASIEPLRIAARSQFMEVMIDLIVAGHAAGLLFDDDAASFVSQGSMVRLPVSLPAGIRFVVTRSDAKPNSRQDRVIQEICRLLAG